MKGLIKGYLNQYAFELKLLLGIFILWKCRGLFSLFGKLTDGAGSVVAGATASVVDAADKAQAKAKIKTINPNATDADIDKFADDARKLAGFMGRLPGVWSNWAYPDRDGVLGVCKQYGRVMFANGKPIKKGTAYLLRKDSLRLPVLGYFYSSVTAGRDLIADVDGAMRLRNDATSKLYFDFLK